MATIDPNSLGGMKRMYGFEERVAFDGTARPNDSGQYEVGIEMNPTLLNGVVDYYSEVTLPHGARIEKVVAKIRVGTTFTAGTAPAVNLVDDTTGDAVTIDITDATHSATIAAQGDAFAESTALAGVLNAPFVGDRKLKLKVAGTPTSVDSGDVTFTIFYKKV